MGGKIILNSVEYVGGDSPAIVDVNELPTNNISKDTFYRKSEDVYVYQRQVLDPSTTVWYGDGSHGFIEVMDEECFIAYDVIGDMVGVYYIDTLTTGQVNSLLNADIIAVKGSLAESKFFGTPDFFGFSESVTIEKGNYKLFHNPTSSPGKYIEVGSGGDLNVIESISIGGVTLPVVAKDVALPLSDTEHPGLVTMDEGITEGSDKPAPSGAVSQLRTQIQGAMQQLSSSVAGKQDKLVSGESIKTLNGESLLGGGNVKLPDTRVSVTEIGPGGASVAQLTRTPIGTATQTITIERVAASDNTGVIVGAYIETADGEETEVLKEVLPNKRYVDRQLADKEGTANKVTSLSAQSTDEQYPSAKCVYDLIGDVETLINAL